MLTPEIAATAPWIGSINDGQIAVPWYWIAEDYYFRTYKCEVWHVKIGMLLASTAIIQESLRGRPRNAATIIAAFKEWCEDNDFEFKARESVATPQLCPECKGSGKVTLFFSVEACSLGCCSDWT